MLRCSELGEYKGFDPEVNPAAATEFSTAAFRFGHSQVNEAFLVARAVESDDEATTLELDMMALNTSYFQPEAVEKAGGVDAFLRGMLLVTAQVREAAHSLGRGLRAVTPHAFSVFWVCLALHSACGHSSCGWCSQLFVRSGACWGAGPACHQHSGTLRVSSLAVCCRSCQCMRATHMLLWCGVACLVCSVAETTAWVCTTMCVLPMACLVCRGSVR